MLTRNLLRYGALAHLVLFSAACGAAERTERMVVVSNNEPIGEFIATLDDRAVEIDYYVDNNGRGPRLDDGPDNALLSAPTNAGGESLGDWTILTGIDFPSPGCWEITGEIRGPVLDVRCVGLKRYREARLQ
jgi:hypothetical protein